MCTGGVAGTRERVTYKRERERERPDAWLNARAENPVDKSAGPLPDRFTLFERLERRLESCLRINCESSVKIERWPLFLPSHPLHPFTREFIDSVDILPRREGSAPLTDKLSCNIDRPPVFQRLRTTVHAA